MMTARIECVGNAAAAADSAAARLDELPRPPSPPLPQSSSAMETVTAASATATRLENAERQMAKMRLDLGELMVVYDDMQVGNSQFAWSPPKCPSPTVPKFPYIRTDYTRWTARGAITSSSTGSRLTGMAATKVRSVRRARCGRSSRTTLTSDGRSSSIAATESIMGLTNSATNRSSLTFT